MAIDWRQEVEKRREEIIATTQEFLKIKSVSDDATAAPGAPFGKGIAEALDYLLHKCDEQGFTLKNLDGYAAHAEYGEGEELLGILCHIDVVPEGDGWTTPPFAAEIRDGNIYARGALDDKGPTMAAFQALKLVKELGLPLQKRVRLIIGTDEESGWKCVQTYFKHEEMPTIGFAPDADFPIIFAEKGICNFELKQKQTAMEEGGYTYRLVQFESGLRLNMVPEKAKAVLTHVSGENNAEALFRQFCSVNNRNGVYETNGEEIVITIDGVSAHGAEPHKGINAGLLLLKFLDSLYIDSAGSHFVSFTLQSFGEDTIGKAIGIDYEDDISGALTLNVGKLRYDSEDGGKISVNMRYPVTAVFDTILEKLHGSVEHRGFALDITTNLVPHHVDKNHKLIKTLQKVYEEQTGDKAELIAIGGGTYARSLQAGVAFGPLFPGRQDTAHQRDEYISINDLLLATAIYAQAIYELAKDAD